MENTILIVDDEMINREVLVGFLSREGHKLITAESGMEALEVVMSAHVDLLLLDIMMPQMNGFEVCRAIRAEPKVAALPIVLVTALNDRNSRIEGIEAGADDFVTKPVDPEELCARTKSILRLNRYRKLLDQQERLTFLESYDALTGLPNRDMLLDTMQQRLFVHERQARAFALVCFGIDAFDVMVDSVGQAGAESLLRETTRRLIDILPRTACVSRIADDKFAVAAFESELEHLASLVEEVRHAIAQPFELDRRQVFLTASAGISVFPDDGSEPDQLLAHASTALSQGRRRAHDSQTFYSEEMNLRASEALSLTNDLRRALNNEEFVLHYQPKVELPSGLIHGAEALVRWQHPNRGLLFPDAFIALAEQSGLIEPLGQWVLNEACRQSREWQQRGLFFHPIAVNVSSVQFTGVDLLTTVRDTLERNCVTADKIELELTESVLMPEELDEGESIIGILRDLKELGCILSIDDFGTGYSSLAYLRRFPVNVLKIDREFVSEIGTSSDADTIVTAIIDLAHNLELDVVAEGVETEEHRRFLEERNCEQAQGYLFSKPVSAREFECLLMEETTPVPPDDTIDILD